MWLLWIMVPVFSTLALFSVRNHLAAESRFFTTLHCMSEEAPDRSLKELLEVAQRAQNLIGHLDLKKVQQHDRLEVEKLKQVVNSIESLENGETVDFVPGLEDVGDSDPPPKLDPEQVRKSKVLEVLDQAGYAGRLGRIFVTDSEFPVKPLEYVPHQEGLPVFDMVVAPDYAPVHGAHGIFVSAQGIFSAMAPAPITENRWRILRSMPYEDDEEMIELVRRYVIKPKKNLTD